MAQDLRVLRSRFREGVRRLRVATGRRFRACFGSVRLKSRCSFFPSSRNHWRAVFYLSFVSALRYNQVFPEK